MIVNSPVTNEKDWKEWKVTEYFCDDFCKGEHGIHICWSQQDFEDFRGFDILNKTQNDDGVYTNVLIVNM